VDGHPLSLLAENAEDGAARAAPAASGRPRAAFLRCPAVSSASRESNPTGGL
jgi:hypothetical protein